MVIETLKTDINKELSEKIKSMLHRAYEGDFSEEDWERTLGGVRYLGWIGDELIANGPICSRTIWLNYIETHVGFIEAIAVEPKFWSKSYGTQLIQLISKDTLSAFTVFMLSLFEKVFSQKDFVFADLTVLPALSITNTGRVSPWSPRSKLSKFE